MVKFAAAGYVCVDYYPDFNNRYYITGNGVDVLFNLLDIKKGKDMEASIISPIFDSQIYQNTTESLILPGFFSGVFSFYYIVFFLNQIWMIDFYDFSRDCLLSFWISFIFLLVRNS